MEEVPSLHSLSLVALSVACVWRPHGSPVRATSRPPCNLHCQLGRPATLHKISSLIPPSALPLHHHSRLHC